MEEVIQYVPNLYATFWALIPPLVAIVLALITKEVYSSLFVGIVIGGLFYGNIFQSGFSFEKSVIHIFEDGLVGVLSDPYNVGILVFLVVLGIMVCMMNKAGGSAAFGEWAGRHIKTRVGAQLVTVLLGILIFIDDYFNCLTVGSVMRPVTDKHNVSRAKLAYLIDATAAPICIIAPISSWAAAVTGFVEGEDGFGIFIKAIPYNYYALFTIAAMILIIALKVDFGSMAVHEANAANGDLYTTPDRPYANATEDVIKGRGKVLDLLFPIITLIVCCIIGMLYSGDFFKGVGFVDAFSESDASVGLMLGSFFALIITIVFYAVRRVLSFNESCSCIPEGFKAMVPAILILTFAWTLKAMSRDKVGALMVFEVSGIAVGFAAIHVGKSSAVDDGIRLGAADIGHSGFAVSNIQLIHINGDHRCFAQALRQRAKGAFFIGQLFLQLGSKLSMAAGNQNFHLVPLSLYRINISGGHRQHCAGAGHRGFCHSARRFPTVCSG